MEKKESMIFYEKSDATSHLCMENMCECNDEIWFTSYYFNALYRMKRDTCDATFVCAFPNEKSCMRMYSKLVSYENKIYCIPLAANSIGIYDIENQSVKSIKIKETSKEYGVKYKSDSKFFDARCEGYYLYLFPHKYPAILRMNLINKEMEYLEEPLKKIESDVVDNSFYFSKVCNHNMKMIMFCNATRKLYFFDNENFIEIISSKIDDGANVLAVANGFAWLFSNNSKQVKKINLDTKEVSILSAPETKIQYGSFPMTRAAVYHKYIYFAPGTADKAIKVNIETNEISLADEITPAVIEHKTGREIWKFCLVEVLSDKLYVFDRTSNQLIRYDESSHKSKREYVQSKKNNLWENQVEREFYLENGRVTTLELFLNYLK